MKKIALLALLLAVVLALTGCGYYSDEESMADDAANKPFVVVYLGTIYEVVYDKETKVMYAVSWGNHNSGTFTLLVNADGTPKLWEGAEK